MMKGFGDVMVIDCSEYGICQTRRRIIAGTVDEIKMTASKEAMVSMNQAFVQVGFQPAGGLRMTSGKAKADVSGGRMIYVSKGFEDVGYTVCHNYPKFYDRGEKRQFSIPLCLMAHLQTFPSDYKFGKKFRQMIAKSVPPKLAAKLILSRYPVTSRCTVQRKFQTQVPVLT